MRDSRERLLVAVMMQPRSKSSSNISLMTTAWKGSFTCGSVRVGQARASDVCATVTIGIGRKGDQRAAHTTKRPSTQEQGRREEGAYSIHKA